MAKININYTNHIANFSKYKYFYQISRKHMRLRKKQKLNLIDNYIAIYRILYNCKILLSYDIKKSLNSNEISKLYKLCDQTLDLKSKYENAFSKLKMIDNSFVLLKQQLNDCKGYPNCEVELCSITEIYDSLNIIQNDYNKLKLN